MLQISLAKPIDKELEDIVDEIEQQSRSLSVLAARQFRYSVSQTAVQVTISESRKLTVLEEFILRAATELNPSPTQEELAQVLGLDDVFIKNTVESLQMLKVLELNSEMQIRITSLGQKFYQNGYVPQEEKIKTLYAISNSLTQKVRFQTNSLVNRRLEIKDISEFINYKNSSLLFSDLSLEEVQKISKDSELGLHVPEQGNFVTSSQFNTNSQNIWQKISLLVIYDASENKVILQARSNDKILENESNLLNQLLDEGKLDLNSLCDLSDEEIKSQCKQVLQYKNEEVEARIDKIRQQALLNINNKQQESSNTQNGTAILLRGKKITQEFENAIESASQEILIFSPWISKKVVDNQFIRRLKKLAQKGVWILIGYGISQNEEDENRPMPEEVLLKLEEVLTPEQIPAVQIYWLGNSHAKEVVIDRKVHLNLSNNMLSCRADWRLWDESGYKVTIPKEVQEAYDFYARRFQSQAENLWEEAIKTNDSKLAKKVIYLWGALGMEDTAFNKIVQNQQHELYPVWLKVICQGLRSGKVSVDSQSLRTALSPLKKVSSTYSLIKPLRQGWLSVFKVIVTHNHQAALNLLTPEVWQNFQRLAIAQPDFNTPTQFINQLPNLHN